MKALILNSGIGKRMGDLTANNPKCLVEIADNETILSRQVKMLLSQGIKDIIITTGPFAEELKAYVQKNFPDLKVEYVQNPRYDSTNYIYSLLLAKGTVNEDIILLHGDLVFDELLLERTINSPEQNAVLINKKAELPEKDFKGRIKGDLVTEISIDIFGEDCFFLIPLYKLSFDLWQKWLAVMEQFEAKDRLNVYAEDALNEILPIEMLYPLYYEEEFCSEIDNLADLEIVRNTLKSKGL